MGKVLDKLLNKMRLNDEDYEEEYDNYDDYDDGYDDYDEPEPAPAPKAAKTAAASSAPREKDTSQKSSSSYTSTGSYSSRSSGKSKIVPLKSDAQPVDEVCVVRPSKYDDAKEIIDILAARKAAVLNLEGSDYDLAQQIIDFISGGCYALKGNIQKVTNYIFVITPEAVEISGDIDIQQTLSGGKGTVPQFQMKV